jgi:hypothetical protein
MFKEIYQISDKIGMFKFKVNEFIVLALLATSIMASVVYTIDWPSERKVASKQQDEIQSSK